MSLQQLKKDLPEALGKLAGLSQPISKLPDDHWTEEIALKTSTDVGPIDVGAGLEAEAHITRRAAAPLTPEGLVGEEGEDELAWASLVLAGKASAKYAAEESVGSGASVKVGFEAGAGARLAQHRRVKQDELALAALSGLARDLRLPFSAHDVRDLGPDDVVEVDLGGTVALQGSVGWKAGLLHELSLEDDAGTALAIQAGVEASVKVLLQLSGDLRLVVRAGSEPEHVLLGLYKRSNQFAGVELSVAAAVGFGNEVKFVDAFLAKAFAMPDDWRDRLAQIHDEIGEVLERIAGWQDDVRKAIDEAIPNGKASLAALAELAGGAALGEAAREALAALPLDRVGNALERTEEVLEKLADASFDAVTDPLEKVYNRVGSWLQGYDRLREKVKSFITSRASQGVHLDLVAGINRARTNEAILELDFDLAVAKAAAAYEQAARGNFEAALQLADAGGPNGVEIHSGTLKRTIKDKRYTGVRLNLFGFELRRDLTRFRELQFEEDLLSGTLTLVGRAGATLSAVRRGQARELSVVFGLAALASRREGTLSYGELGTEAVIGRTATLTGKSAARAIPRHVGGAVGLGLLAPPQAEALVQALLREKGEYRYELQISLPQETVRRALLLDSGLTSKQVVPHVRSVLRTAVSFLDVVLEAHGGEDVLLSSLLTGSVLDAVTVPPLRDDWERFYPVLPGGRHLVRKSQLEAWVYLKHANSFIDAYVAAREKLLQDRPPAEVAKELRRLAAAIRLPPGALAVAPLDSKFLSFVLLGQTGGEHVRLTLRRGDVDVTV
ncbi:MAG TPA: hypothetical protein VHQ65_07650 [Thermoanaerobaculia bacterium]|nr:hypothetical protein [Thermoanaerobaculia bacterium]